MNRPARSKWNAHAVRAGCAITVLAACPAAFAGSATLTTLASFDARNGANPFVTLARDGSGNLYGTTEYGGIAGNEQGALFEYNIHTGQLSAPVLFNGADGANPIGSLYYDGNGHFFGTTRAGGAGGGGTLFEFSPATQTLTTLFNFNGANGASPYAGVISDGKGNLFGTTNAGGADDKGTVFKFNLATQSLTTLATFKGANGADPFGGLTLDSRGNLYGTTRDGGSSGLGTVFKISADTHALTTLVNFNGANGEGPTASLLRGPDGNLYGTTAVGGKNDAGVLFKIGAFGTASTLLSFDNDTGENPIGSLLADAKGNLYGTTQIAGAQGGGTVYRVNPSTRKLSVLADFDGASWALDGGLIADSQGNLYGTTYYGGENHNASFFGVFGDGTIFKLTDTGFAVKVPEPASLALLAGGVAALALRRRRG